MYDALVRNIDGSIDYIKIKGGKLICVNYSKNGVTKSNSYRLHEIFSGFLFNQNCNFVGYYKDYEIYYDEVTGIKHFLKNGKEDFNLLFECNGTDAILYKKIFSDETKQEIKQFFFRGATVFISLAFIISLHNTFVPRSYALDDKIEQIYGYDQDEILSLESVDYEQALKYINESNLDERTKQILSNEDLLKDVFKHYSNTPLEYTASLKFNNINVEEFNVPFDMFDGYAGYYSSNQPNVIKVNSEYISSELYEKIVAHEYIHLLQAEGLPYLYLVESSAELIAHEYYGYDIITYKPAVENLKLLINIIGPEPVMKLLFAGDDEQFKAILKDNLSGSDYIILLNCFEKGAKVCNDENDETHNKVRTILCNLYKSLNGSDITEDSYIMYDLIYNPEFESPVEAGNFLSYKEEYYFNHRLMSPEQEVVRTLDVNKLCEAGYCRQETFYDCCKEIQTIEEYYELLLDDDIILEIYDKYDSNNRPYGTWINDRNEYFVFDKSSVGYMSYNTEEDVWSYDLSKMSGRYISIEEAFEKGYIGMCKYKIMSEKEYNSSEGWDYINFNKKYIFDNPNIKVNSRCGDSIEIIITQPSIMERFPEQYTRMLSDISNHIKTYI